MLLNSQCNDFFLLFLQVVFNSYSIIIKGAASIDSVLWGRETTWTLQWVRFSATLSV